MGIHISRVWEGVRHITRRPVDYICGILQYPKGSCGSCNIFVAFVYVFVASTHVPARQKMRVVAGAVGRDFGKGLKVPLFRSQRFQTRTAVLKCVRASVGWCLRIRPLFVSMPPSRSCTFRQSPENEHCRFLCGWLVLRHHLTEQTLMCICSVLPLAPGH